MTTTNYPTYYGLKEMCAERNIEITRLLENHRYHTAIILIQDLMVEIDNTPADKPTTVDESWMCHGQRLVFHTLVNAGCRESVAMETASLVEWVPWIETTSKHE